MNIGIIGSGNMGRTLGLVFMEKGHNVFFGSRNKKDFELIEKISNKKIQYGNIEEAVEFGSVLLYSLRDELPTSILPANKWENKIIIDCNNVEIPADFDYPPIMVSFTEKYQNDVPKANVIKAFNISAQELYNHDFVTLKNSGAVNLIAGDDSDAKEIVSKLIKEIGLKPVDCGSSIQAKLIESFGNLVRMLMTTENRGPLLTFNTQILPEPENKRFGERQTSNYK